MRAVGLLLVLAATGCAKSNAVVCRDGVVCPAETICDTANGGCIVQDQIEVCRPLDANAACELPDGAPGLCTNGVCLGHACGDGRRSGPEQCDPTSTEVAATQTDCIERGYYNDAPVACAADCTWDVGLCGSRCGDAVLDAQFERCEIDIPIEGSCLDYAFDRGVLGCGACVASFLECGEVGWKPVSVPGMPTRGSVNGTTLAVALGGSASIAARFDGVVFQPLGSFDYPAGTPIGLDVSVNSATDIWVVGDLGTPTIAIDGFVAHYDGTAWELVRTFDTVITRVYSAGTHVWAIEGATVHHYDGATWSEQTLSTSEQLSIEGTGADDVWIAGGLLWHGGATTAFTPVTGPGGTLKGLAVLPGGTVLTTTLDSGTNRMRLHTRTNNVWLTTTYAPANLFNRGEILAVAADDVYVVFDDGNSGLGINHVAHYNGTAWHQLSTSAASQTNFSMRPLSLAGSASLGVFAFDSFAVRAYRYTGSAWVTSAVINGVIGMVAISPTEIYGTDASRNVLRFDGVAWSPTPQTAKGFVDSASAQATYSLELGAPPRIWHRTGADTWSSTALAQGNFDTPLGVLGVDDLFFMEHPVGSTRHVRHWNGSTVGTTNVPITTSVLDAFRDIDCRPTFGCTIVGPVGVWHTAGAPDGWAAVATPAIDARAVWIAPDGTTFVGGTEGRMMWAAPGNSTWSSTAFRTFGDVLYIAGTSANDVFAVAQTSGGIESLHHFDGLTWSDVRMPYTQIANSVRSLLAFDGGVLVGSAYQSITFHLARTSAW